MAYEIKHHRHHHHHNHHHHHQQDPHSSHGVAIEKPKVILATRQIAVDLDDRDLYVKCSIREMIVYAVFFVLLVISCSDIYSHDMFEVNQKIASLFLDASFEDTFADTFFIKYRNIYTMEHFWKYSKDVLCEKLYGINEHTMAKEIMPNNINSTNTTETKNNTFSTIVFSVTNESDIINYENKLLYRPRSRQVRVEEGHCHIRNQFKGLFKECYVPYRLKYEDKKPFGPGNGTEWIYSNADKTQGLYYSGRLAYYGAGGYFFNFPKTSAECLTKIKDLEHNTWLNRGTRAVFVDFAVYNGNANTICVVKLVFEFPESGGIIPSYSIRTAQIHEYYVTDSKLGVICAITVFAFVMFYYTTEELFEASYFKLRYFTIFWNMIDFCIVILIWACATMIALMVKAEPTSKIEDSLTSGQGHKFFDNLVTRHESLNLMTAVLLFVACIKTIKYFDVTKTMTIIYLSIDRCFSAVTKYLVVIMIVVFSFAVLGYCAFGTQVEGFSTIGNSLMSAMRILVRDFDYRSIEHVDQTLTTIFFNMYTCVVVFVFLTMLVAIAFHAYFDVDIEDLIGDRKPYVWDKVKPFFNRLFKRRDMAKSELEYMSYEDIYKLLRRWNLTKEETENTLKRNNVEPHGVIHENQVKQLFDDLLTKPTQSEVYAGTSKNSVDNDKIVQRMESLEKQLDKAIENITVVISRLYLLRSVLRASTTIDQENRSTR